EQHKKEEKDERAAPPTPHGNATKTRPKKRNRQHPQHRQKSDNKGRPGALIRNPANRQHLQPAHRENDDPDQPQPPKVGFSEEPHPGRDADGGYRHGLSAENMRPGACPACRRRLLPTFPPIGILRFEPAWSGQISPYHPGITWAKSFAAGGAPGSTASSWRSPRRMWRSRIAASTLRKSVVTARSRP